MLDLGSVITIQDLLKVSKIVATDNYRHGNIDILHFQGSLVRDMCEL